MSLQFTYKEEWDNFVMAGGGLKIRLEIKSRCSVQTSAFCSSNSFYEKIALSVTLIGNFVPGMIMLQKLDAHIKLYIEQNIQTV